MLVKTFTDKLGNVLHLKLKNKVEFLLYDDSGDKIGNLILWDEPMDNFYRIKDTFLEKNVRGRGIWRMMMYYVLQYVKTHMKSDGLLSLAQFRRPASDKAWKSLEKFAEIKMTQRRKDYYLKDMKLESKSFNVLTFNEFVNESIEGLKSATKKKRQVLDRMDKLERRVDKNQKKYQFYSDKEEYEKKLNQLHNQIKAEDDPIQRAKLREEINKLESEWKGLQAKHKSQIKAT
jgi:predicted GNAT family acetyltransferase